MIEYIQYISIYLIIAVLFLLTQLAPAGVNTNHNILLNRFISILILTFLFILTAFRHEDIGTDTTAYLEIYEWFKVNDFNGRYEPLFAEITRLLTKYTDNSRVFLIIFALLAYLPIYFFLKIESKNALYASLLFFIIFFIDYVTMLRQSVALSIVMIGLIFLQKNKVKAFYLCILLAAGFHLSALIGFLFPLLKNITFSIKRAFLAIMFAIYISLSKFFSSGLLASGSISKYINDDPASGILIVIYLLFFLLTLIVVRISGYQYDSQSKLNLYLWMSVGCVICQILTLDMPILFRFTYYFALSFLVLVPCSVYGFERQRYIFLLLTFYPLPFVAYQFLIFYFRPHWGEVFPYQFG
jgi:hypothetical protein